MIFKTMGLDEIIYGVGIARKIVQGLILRTLSLAGWEDKRRLKGVTSEVGGDPRESGVLEPSKKPGNRALPAVLSAAHM